MARTFKYIIEDIFNDWDHCPITPSSNNPTTGRKFMEIPVDDEVFEVPIFAFSAFREMLKKDYPGTVLVASLYSYGQMSSYKTLDRALKDVLTVKFNSHLQKIIVPNSENFYYATLGAIFDKDFKPLMMLSWLLRHGVDALDRKIKYIRPILRLDALSFTAKEDALQRFLSGRLLSASLDVSIKTPYFPNCNNYFEQTYSPYLPIKVEIDKCPFCIKETDVPSISTTNESLLSLAGAHIDEMI